jgi:26S proteasome regulatory subunit T3
VLFVCFHSIFGRLDRKVEFPNPDRRQKRLIFGVCTAKMNLHEEIELEDYVKRPEKLSAAEITAVCQVISSSLSCRVSVYL